MAQINQLDSVSFPMRVPFDTILNPLNEAPRLTSGENILVTTGGYISKRRGTSLVPATGALPAGARADRLYSYTTMEQNPKTYIVASVFVITNNEWSVYYCRPGNSTAWTKLPDLRDINDSTRPHEMAESRGLLYIKGYPASGSSEKLGTVIFDGTDLSVKPWGALGPDTPAHMSNQFKVGDALYSSWTPSSHPFDVKVTWEYTYAYKSITGNVTNRSKIETNPDLPSSNTGQFSNLKPRIVYKVPPDPVNFPTVIMYRTQDGGGIWYKLDEIDVSAKTPNSFDTYEDNTLISGIGGTGPWTTTLNGAIDASQTTLVVASATTFPYYGTFAIRIDSEYFEVTGISGTTFTVVRGYADTTPASHSNGATITYFGLDPLPDSLLDQASRAPSLTSNTPPPTVLAENEEVIGVDTPDPSTPMAKFSGRLWYGIGNYLFYSALEELDEGIPEECWPSGLRGNFFRLQEPVVGLVPTSEALYIWTTRKTYILRGANKTAFSIEPLFSDVGAKDGYGMIAKGDRVYWISNNNRIFRAKDYQKESIGDPLGNTLSSLLAPANGVDNLKISMSGYQNGIVDWVIVQLTNLSVDYPTRTLVFDLQQEGLFWQTPWTLPFSFIESGQLYETDTTDYFIGTAWNRATNTCELVQYNPAIVTDRLGGVSVNYGCSLKTNLIGIATGNNVNTYKKPAFIPVTYCSIVDRRKFTSDTDPAVLFFIDSEVTSVAGGTAYPPPRRPQSVDLLSLKYSDNIYKAGEKIAISLTKTASSEDFELLGLRFVWEYSNGVGY